MKQLLLMLLLVLLCSCAPKPQAKIPIPPLPEQPLPFEQGIKLLASNIAIQLQNNEIDQTPQETTLWLQQKPESTILKNVVLDPFIDTDTGYAVKANAQIVSIFEQEWRLRFNFDGILAPEKIQTSDYVLNGMVTLESGPHSSVHRILSTVFEKNTGKIIASGSIVVSGFDNAPLDIYKDSPIYLKGATYKDQTESINKSASDFVNTEYANSISIKSFQTKGDELYERKEFNKSLAYYNQVPTVYQNQLTILNGQFTNLVQQNRWDEAEQVYAQLLRASIRETSDISSKIKFKPKLSKPIDEKLNVYNIYCRQIALFLKDSMCSVQVIGHCSKSGSADYNLKLSQERSRYIQMMMVGFVPEVKNRIQSIGRGYQETIVGSGADNDTDEIDRRVEFKFTNCPMQ